jgi:tyrosinase
LRGDIDRAFVAPRPGGALEKIAAKDMLDTTSPRLDYAYEDVSDPFSGVRRAEVRAKRLAIAEPLASRLLETRTSGSKPSTELIGSLDDRTFIEGGVVNVSISLDRRMIAKTARSFESVAETGQEPDRIYLNLQDIRSSNDAAIFEVYIDLPNNTVPNDQPDHLGGVVSLFGVSRKPRADGRNCNGINKVIDITPVVDRLHISGRLRHGALSIQIVPTSDIRPEDRISVGRMGIYRRNG